MRGKKQIEKANSRVSCIYVIECLPTAIAVLDSDNTLVNRIDSERSYEEGNCREKVRQNKFLGNPTPYTHHLLSRIIRMYK